jgi:hypothetical protein
MTLPGTSGCCRVRVAERVHVPELSSCALSLSKGTAAADFDKRRPEHVEGAVLSLSKGLSPQISVRVLS